jgi:hypothetical protein
VMPHTAGWGRASLVFGKKGRGAGFNHGRPFGTGTRERAGGGGGRGKKVEASGEDGTTSSKGERL